MTLNEYVEKITQEIKDSASKQKALSVVEKAQRVLNDSKIAKSAQEQFWIDLYESLGGSREFIAESQDAAALSAIISAAKAVIAEKANK